MTPGLPAPIEAELTQLRRWKQEATEVILGLQDLGRALGLPLGEQITGRVATETAKQLTDRIQAVEALHVPWYEVNGVRHDNLVHVSGEDVPADHICRVGPEFQRCELDPVYPEDSVHVVPACSECRAVTEDGEPGYKLWPCRTRLAVTPSLRDRTTVQDTGEPVPPADRSWITTEQIKEGPRPTHLMCPECAQGKHGNCDGTAWNDAADDIDRCRCSSNLHRGGNRG